MALLPSVTCGTAIAMVFLPTTLFAWMSGGESLVGDDFDEDYEEDIVSVVTVENVYFEILEPAKIAYTYKILPARDFGAPFDAHFSERKIGLVPVKPATGCRRPDNADQVKGRVALVLRGDCSFYKKALIAEEIGAKAIIVADDQVISIEHDTSHRNDYAYISMTRGPRSFLERNVTIPAAFLHGKNGQMINETLISMNLDYAIINVPLNLTFASLDDFHPPPWLSL